MMCTLSSAKGVSDPAGDAGQGRERQIPMFLHLFFYALGGLLLPSYTDVLLHRFVLSRKKKEEDKK